MNEACRITVSILTCNRKARVAELLADLRRQTLPHETVLVDNASADGTEELVREAFPEVRYIRLPTNDGCAGRNEGLKAVSSPIVVTLDDDVFFHRDDELARILACFEANSNADAINFKILDPDTKEVLPFNWFHPRAREEFAAATFETDYISEGAIAFRRAVFSRAGFYPDDYFLSHEGYDLAYRILNAGGTVLYTGDVEVIHKCEIRQRATWRNAYYNTRNYVWLLTKFMPWPSLLVSVPYRLATTFLFSLQRGQLYWWAKAVWDAFKGLPCQWKKRSVLSPATRGRLREIRRLEPRFLYKLRDFVKRTSAHNRSFPPS